MGDKVEQVVSAIPAKMLRPLLIATLTVICSLTLVLGGWAYSWKNDREAKEDKLSQQVSDLTAQVSGLTAAVNQFIAAERERAAEVRDNRREMREFRQQLLDAVRAAK